MVRYLANLCSLAAIVLSLGIGSHAFAGARYLYGVNVGRTNGGSYASGPMYGARLSADSIQYISCTTWNYSSSNPSLSCGARNSAGTYAGCYSSSTEPGFWYLHQAVLAIHSSSWISFGSDASGRCVYVLTGTNSYELP